MQTHHQSSRYHGHRYHLEQDTILAGMRDSSAAQRAVWNLADRLKAIDEAEQIRARSYLSMDDHYRVFATLAGRTPDEARAAAHVGFENAYSAAIFGERAVAA